MRIVALSEFRRKCSVLLRLVNKTHETIQVTQFGRPLADIKPPGFSDEERAARSARDREILNRFADELNAEAEESFEYLAPVSFDRSRTNKIGRKKKSRRRP